MPPPMMTMRRASVGCGLLMANGVVALRRGCSRSARAGQTTIGGTDIVTRAACAERTADGLRLDAFADQFADHFDERRVCADRRRADHVETELCGELARLRIEIIDHLHVIGDEADGRDDDILCAAGAGHERWRLDFQSRSGPPQQPWL